MAESQRDDSELAACMETGTVTENPEQLNSLPWMILNFTLLDRILYFMISKSMQQTILLKSHSGAFSGHLAVAAWIIQEID